MLERVDQKSSGICSKSNGIAETNVGSMSGRKMEGESESHCFLGKTIKNIRHLVYTLLNDSVVIIPICILLFFLEATLLEFIIMKVPYTEIDYSTYMQQINLVKNGEYDYFKITGDTGPIVYPGGYILVYWIMDIITNGMENLKAGQESFRLLYLVSLALTFLIYLQYNNGVTKIKPYYFYMLILSKRLHSIYVLRLFNDCFTTFCMLLTILLLQLASKFKRQGHGKSSLDSSYATIFTVFSVIFFSFGISIKMNALLYLPGFLIIIYFLNDENLIKSLGMILIGIFVQCWINLPFLVNGEIIRDHFINGAFNFKREFMYKWTVNWKFLNEDLFSSREFHVLLLSFNVITLLIFIFNKWISENVTGKSIWQLLINDGLLKFYKNTIHNNNVIFSDKNTEYVTLVMVMSNLIGVLYSRSLHYQFLCWYFYSLPLVLSQSGLPYWVTVPIFVIHEICWNIYPSNALSSAALVGILCILVNSVHKNKSTRFAIHETNIQEKEKHE